MVERTGSILQENESLDVSHPASPIHETTANLVYADEGDV